MEPYKALAWKRLAQTWRGLALDAMHAEMAALEEARDKTEALVAAHERLAQYEIKFGRLDQD